MNVLFILMLMVFIPRIQDSTKMQKKLKKYSYDEMLEMASLGLKSNAANFCAGCKIEQNRHTS